MATETYAKRVEMQKQMQIKRAKDAELRKQSNASTSRVERN